ncbi:MAG: hypothetical protein EHM23_25900 [Acidobacteria bacterium]|nr:MAG: hypothetical protein EHM23_25900 [Acidobacteriota bacterium]
MRLHAPCVSASESGDEYYQLYFGPEESEGEFEEKFDRFNFEVKGPYLLIQRQFEMPDGGRCYVETDREGYSGHFRLRLMELSPARLSFQILGRKLNNRVEVSFSLNARQFAEVRSVAEIVFG